MQANNVSMFASVHESPYAYFANPAGVVAVQCCYSSHQTAPWQKGEKGGKNSFWVIYSGGSGLNQGTAAVWLTHFDLSSSIFSPQKLRLFFIVFLPLYYFINVFRSNYFLL